LGDLAPFRSIAEDTLSLVDRHDLAAAKTRIKDLERAWDAAEERLQPMNPDDWTIVDEAIDHALAELRTAQPDAATCAAALKRVIAQCKAL
jgi:sarcosine oxidase gamma subunit